MENESGDTQASVQVKESAIIPSLCIGFCGLVGLLVTGIIGLPLPLSYVLLACALIGVPLGWLHLEKRKAKAKPIVVSLLLALLLAPILLPLGIATGFLLPVLPSHIKAFLNGPNVIRSVTSPDGNFEAYVVESPSIDPPNQSLYIQRSDKTRFVRVEKLPEDIDRVLEIHWSPQGDVVVFHNRCSLVAVRVPGFQIVKIPLGKEWRRHKAGMRSTFSGAGPHVKVAAIQFLHPGTFGYRLEGANAFKTIDMSALDPATTTQERVSVSRL